MGSNQSKQSSPPSKEQLIERHGVLIPPNFAIAGNGSILASEDSANRQSTLSTYDRLPLTPSLVEHLSATHFGEGLLRDYMTPGMWVLAGGRDATATTTVQASLPQGNGGSISFCSSPTAFPDSRVVLRTGTDGPMQFFGTHKLFHQCYLRANANSAGSGYVGGQVGLTLNQSNKSSSIYVDDQQFIDWEVEENEASDNVHLQLGSWVPLKANKFKGKQGWLQPLEQVHGFVSVDMLGSTSVVETKLNLNTLESEVSKYFSVLLNGGPQSTTNGNALPLFLTMSSTPQNTTINISQLLTFDRINLNIADTRAPMVRNTFGWSVQLDRPISRADRESPSLLSVAAAWQANRNVAFKVVGTTNQGTTGSSSNAKELNFSLLLKRWKQPRMVCSVLGRYDVSGFGFVGIGLELETDHSTFLGGDNYAPICAQVSDQHVPETKAMLR